MRARCLFKLVIMLTPALLGHVCPSGKNFICCKHTLWVFGLKVLLQVVELYISTVTGQIVFRKNMLKVKPGRENCPIVSQSKILLSLLFAFVFIRKIARIF